MRLICGFPAAFHGWMTIHMHSHTHSVHDQPCITMNEEHPWEISIATPYMWQKSIPLCNCKNIGAYKIPFKISSGPHLFIMRLQGWLLVILLIQNMCGKTIFTQIVLLFPNYFQVGECSKSTWCPHHSSASSAHIKVRTRNSTHPAFLTTTLTRPTWFGWEARVWQ